MEMRPQVVVNDLKRGFYHNRFLFAAIFVVALLYCNIFINGSSPVNKSDIDAAGTGVGDIMFLLFRGNDPYTIVNGNQFVISPIWMSLVILPILLLFSYCTNDIDLLSGMVLIQSGKRNRWWFSKCIWCIVTVIMFYAILFVAALMSVIVNYGFDNLAVVGVSNNVLNSSGFIDEMLTSAQLLLMILVPLISSIALGLLQMLISLAISPIISIIAMIVLYVIAAFYINPYIITDYMMYKRWDCFIKGGVNPIMGIVVAIIIIIGSIIIGDIYFKRHNVI